jgi:hypothetical protein
MKKVPMILSLILSAIFIVPTTSAATSEIKWTNPDDYRDIYSGEEHRKHFRERTFKTLEKHFSSLAKQLPQGQMLKIEITDVDLAGDVQHGGTRQIRLVKEIYFPKMKFSYQVVDAANNELSAGQADLKDMTFMTGINLRYRNDSLGYEKKMLDNWFKDTFIK